MGKKMRVFTPRSDDEKDTTLNSNIRNGEWLCLSIDIHFAGSGTLVVFSECSETIVWDLASTSRCKKI